MKLIVYRQSMKERENGVISYKGEDTLPFANDSVLLVADGLGGRASIRHSDVDAALFDEHLIADFILDEICTDTDIDEDGKAEVSKYIVDSFMELRAVKSCYTDNIYNIKKSGYFGSRFVSAIVLSELLLHKESIKEMFPAIAEKGSEVFCGFLSSHFTKAIKEKMVALAKKCNINYDSSFQNLALLGTTLCAAIVQENEDTVDVVYLSAGDSRPYVWDSINGLRQVLPDEEGADGGMTNYISANNEFTIRCNYFKFSKPCILFNASDGVFDTKSFINQLCLENLLLDTIVKSDSLESVANDLTDFFEADAKHDDSSTIAMGFYGFASFDDVKNAASDRLLVIKSEYLDLVPDLLTHNYCLDGVDTSSDDVVEIEQAKVEFFEQQVTKKICRDKIIEENYPAYIKKKKLIDDEIKQIETKLEELRVSIKDIISRNFVGLIDEKDASKIRVSLDWQRIGYPVIGIIDLYATTRDLYLNELKDRKQITIESFGIIESTFSRLIELADLDGDLTVSNSEVDFTKAFEEIKKSNDYLVKVYAEKQKTLKELNVFREKYYSRNYEEAIKKPDVVEYFLKNFLEIDGAYIPHKFIANDKDKLGSLIVQYRELMVAKTKKVAEHGDCLNEFVKAYWDENFLKIVTYFESNLASYSGDKVLLDNILLLLKEKQEKEESEGNYAQKQSDLFAKYNATYESLLN
ncbi:MAG: SpoIIE family protein phosphatase [Clostridia bacterium]|nr:SpoIIE family protein phosphatase [Clostridia bacterium]